MKIRILFVGPWNQSFIQRDLDILIKHFDVRVVEYMQIKKHPLFLFKLIKGVLWADVTFSWFADFHALVVVLLAKIFRKKSIVVVGGYEVANVPEIGYGLMLSPISAWKVKYVLKNADKVLAVSEFNEKEFLKYTNQRRNIELVYNCIDYNKFRPSNKKEDIVITVGNVSDHVMRRKGLETFVKAAEYLPNIKFILIGKHSDSSIKHLKSIASSNVDFPGFVSDEDLLKYYQRAKVYCQLSMYESFGMALAEAMSCGCVPVVTNNAALPEVVGDTGFYVPYGDPKATAEAIEKALKTDKGKLARERIKNKFPIERREKELISEVRKVVNKR